MTEGVVRNGLWYPDDRDWVEVRGCLPDWVAECHGGDWKYMDELERKNRSYDDRCGDAPPEAIYFEGCDIVAVLDLRPKPRPRKDNGPSADTQARDWCHQQWTETERELRKANAYIRELEAKVECLEDDIRARKAMWRTLHEDEVDGHP